VRTYPRQSREEIYRTLCGSADRYREQGTSMRATRTMGVLVRSAKARRTVLIRSEGECENPRCTGRADDQTDSGDPILEIDHIHDLAQGGADGPAQMIALCPNCHAIKTRGSTREQLRNLLLVTAEERHTALPARSRSRVHGDTLPRNTYGRYLPFLASAMSADHVGKSSGSRGPLGFLESRIR